MSGAAGGAILAISLSAGGVVQRVNGFGGFSFRARDPERLARWNQNHLGIRRTGSTYEAGSGWQDAGPTIFEPFPADTDYFGRNEQAWMINLRVADLDGMLEQLESAGIEVSVDPRTFPNGRFASVRDPGGSPIELWQPDVPDLVRPDDVA